MKSLSIHGIDDPVYRLLKARAKSEGKSVNQTVKSILEQSLGVTSSAYKPHRREFETMCGTWTVREKEDFDKATKEFEKIDPKEWK
jgi:plasmid stability protein